MIPVYPISVYYQGFSPIQRILKSPKIDQAIFPHFYKLKENGINHFSKLVTTWWNLILIFVIKLYQSDCYNIYYFSWNWYYLTCIEAN